MSKSRPTRSEPAEELAATSIPNREVPALTPEDIAERAHALYMARGATHGQHLEDWLQAELELKAERQTSPAGDAANTK